MPYPTEPLFSTAAVVNGKIYSIGFSGYDPERIEVYDPMTDTWAVKASMPKYYGFHTIAAYQNKVYDFVNNLSYDTINDNWTAIAPIPVGRTYTQPNVVDGKIYVIGGFVSAGFWGGAILSSNWAYTPENDSWSIMAPIPTAVANYASSVVDGKIYIIGGLYYQQYKEPGRFSNLVQIYDTQTNLWSRGAPMPINMSGMGATATNGFMAPKAIYVIGGQTLDENVYPMIFHTLNTTLIYDPKTDAWSTGTPVPTARYGLSLVNVNDKLFALGGDADERTWLLDNEEYTPADYGSSIPSPTQNSSPSPRPTPLTISILSPVNGSDFSSVRVGDTYPDVSFHLIYQASQVPSWVGYSIDGGGNVTVSQTDTLVKVPATDYNHTLTLYANDTLGNWATPQTANYFILTIRGPTASPPTSPSPSTSVPEFPAWTTMALIVTAMLLAVFLVKRNVPRRKVNSSSIPHS